VISVEVHCPLPLSTGCHNRLGINELDHHIRRLIFSVDAVWALDAALVLRAVSTVADGRNAG